MKTGFLFIVFLLGCCYGEKCTVDTSTCQETLCIEPYVLKCLHDVCACAQKTPVNCVSKDTCQSVCMNDPNFQEPHCFDGHCHCGPIPGH